jgi:hypothetical protein
MDEQIEYDVDGVAKTIVDQRGLGPRETIEGVDVLGVRTPREPFVVESGPVRSTEPATKKEEEEKI